MVHEASKEEESFGSSVIISHVTNCVQDFQTLASLHKHQVILITVSGCQGLFHTLQSQVKEPKNAIISSSQIWPPTLYQFYPSLMSGADI